MTRQEETTMAEPEILDRIQTLVEEERSLRSDGTGADPDRLAQLGATLDQCWDLLRQRRALREFGADEAAAEVHDADHGRGLSAVTANDRSAAWPALPVAAWEATRDTLHLWTQIVGKIRLALAPMLNHWWQVPLYVTATGLTTSLMPYRDGGVEIAFDFRRQVLVLTTVDGQRREVALEPRTVADFHAELFARLREVGVDVTIMARPVEVPVAIPFADDHEHAAYDPEFVHRYWRSLVSVDRVLTQFRGGFLGKASPVHFFWGSFDLAVTRFSGRPAPRHPGGMPNCPDWVMHEAYSHEVSSAGYWPGGADEGLFYAYAYPEPDGYRDVTVAPAKASFDDTLGEFILPYRTVRTADDPDGTLLGFLESTYAAAADLARWDRATLEVTPHPGSSRP
jgi:hypothetical protein